MGLCVGHVDDEIVTSTPADVRESYASVASRALDYRASGLQQAAFFGVFDDIERGAVFDAAAGVLELGLSEDSTRRFGGEGIEFYERSVADCFLGKPLV